MNKVLIACFAVFLGACGGISMKCQGSNCGIVGGEGGTTSDMAGSAYGCAGKGGFKPDPNPQSVVWACPGEFAAGVIRQRCAVGYKLCSGQPLVTERCMETNTVWRGWGQFLFDNQIISDNDSTQSGNWDQATVACAWDKKYTKGKRGMGVCGVVTGFGSVLIPGLPACADPTAYFAKCWDLGGLYPLNKWSCPAPPGGGDADFELVANADVRNGVLCCPN